jgi:transposase
LPPGSVSSPKPESSGRTKLGNISKRGNKDLRPLFIQAADIVLEPRPAMAMRALWPRIEKPSSALRNRNLPAIVLASKLARIAWARPWPRRRTKDYPNAA